MTRPDFTIKRHATGPAVQIRVTNESDGQPVDFTGATGTFFMYDFEGNVLVNAPLTVVDPSDGLLSYVWQVGDTAQAGTHRAEFQVTLIDSTVEVYPREGYISVKILSDLSDS